jgi:hypothetical protein
MSVVLEPGDWIHLAVPLPRDCYNEFGVPKMEKINKISDQTKALYNAMGVFILEISYHSDLKCPTVVSVIRGTGKTGS